MHHFKWIKGQYKATQYKAKVWANTSIGEAYNIVLKHLEHCGGICVKTQNMKCTKQILNLSKTGFRSHGKEAV